MQKLLYNLKSCVDINGNNADNRKSNLVSLRGLKNNGKTFLNGYIAVYMPEHPRAFRINGCVYEHFLIAEQILGRQLKAEECVHHINHNRTDNRKENLMIFKTSKDHICFHGGGTPIKQDDGTYITESKFEFDYLYLNRTRKEIDNGIKDIGSVIIKNKNLCPICKENLKDIKAKQCLKCYRKQQMSNIPSKNELEMYIYDIPFVKIGEIFGVSDHTVRKWCKRYGLPSRKKDIGNSN